MRSIIQIAPAMVILLFSLSATANSVYPAGNWAQPSSGFDFVAPIINSGGSGTGFPANKQVGMIVYDMNGNQFKGLNANGNWDSISAAGLNAVTSVGNTERVERITAAEGSTCTVSPCTINRSSGSSTTAWVASLTFTTAGDYTVNFQSGIWATPPSCSITTNSITISNGSATTSSIKFATYTLAGALTAAKDIQIVCMGRSFQ